jgi:stage II sporulation protein D
VRETRGLALVKDGRLVLTDYYDDCGGVTAPGDDDSDFPPSVVDAVEGGADYCAAGRSHTWRLVLSAEEAERIAHSIPRWPAGAKVVAIDVADTDVSGRARTVRFVSVDGAAREIRGSALRGLVGYSRLKSTLFTVSRTDDGFRFEGRGYGHGRGMCQAGAIGMASPPYARSFRDILGHYFPGAAVEEWRRSE